MIKFLDSHKYFDSKYLDSNLEKIYTRSISEISIES